MFLQVKCKKSISTSCDLHILAAEELRMFIVFWDTGSHIFQSDPNKNSDSTALFGHELKSDPNCSRWDLKEIGLDLK